MDGLWSVAAAATQLKKCTKLGGGKTVLEEKTLVLSDTDISHKYRSKNLLYFIASLAAALLPTTLRRVMLTSSTQRQS